MEKEIEIKLPEWLRDTPSLSCPPYRIVEGRGFIEKNLKDIVSFFKKIFEPSEFADKMGLLQIIDPRARVFGILLLILSAAIQKNIIALIGSLLLVLILTVVSKISISVLLKRVLPIFLFTIFMTLPVVFNFIMTGTPVLTIIKIYGHEFYVSKEGIKNISLISLRVVSMASYITLLLLTTGYANIFKTLRYFPIPKIFVTAFAMTFRYILVLVRVAEDSHLSRKSRTIKPATLKEAQSWLSARICFIIERSIDTAENVYLAMKARGFTGEIKTLTVFEMRGRDYLWIGFSMFILLLATQK